MNDGCVSQFRLYILGDSPIGKKAKDNFKKIQAAFLTPDTQLEVIDILLSPEQAEKDHIIAVPALVRVAPPPSFKIIGDLSDIARLRSFFPGAEFRHHHREMAG